MRYIPYRGPLSDGVSTEAVSEVAGSEEVQLPRAAANEDDATYNTSLSEFEVWMKLLDSKKGDDDPPPSAPDSALPWWLQDDDSEDDDQDAEKIAA